MDGCESPLDVLTRAATMVQHGSTNSASVMKGDPVLKELPSARWRRERRLQEKLADFHKGAITRSRSKDLSGPLDMSLRSRPPPSYSESIAAVNHRPSVITCHYKQVTSKQDKNRNNHSTAGTCDPMIDEHFRRSLGNDYLSLFNDDSTSHSGLSVDDHFEKALGDTWAKLKMKSPKERRRGTAQIVTTNGRTLTAPTPVLST